MYFNVFHLLVHGKANHKRCPTVVGPWFLPFHRAKGSKRTLTDDLLSLSLSLCDAFACYQRHCAKMPTFRFAYIYLHGFARVTVTGTFNRLPLAVQGTLHPSAGCAFLGGHCHRDSLLLVTLLTSAAQATKGLPLRL